MRPSRISRNSTTRAGWTAPPATRWWCRTSRRTDWWRSPLPETAASLDPAVADAARALLADYGIDGRDAAVGFTAQGADNLNRRLDAGGRSYVVRAYNVTAPEEIGYELALIEHLTAHGFRTAAVHRRRDGGLISDLQGRAAALFDFVEGGPIDPDAAENRVRIAALTGELHHITHGWIGPGRRSRTDPGRLRRFEQLAAETPEIAARADVRQFLGEIAILEEDFRRGLEAAGEALPRGAIHHDLNPGNVLADGTGEIVALLDFDEAHESELVFDLASLLHYWALPERESVPEMDPRRVREIVGAYEPVRPLTRAERMVLPAAVLMFHAADAADFLGGRFRRDPRADVSECRSLSVFRALRVSRDWTDAIAEAAG